MTKTPKRHLNRLFPGVLDELDKLAEHIDTGLHNLRRPGPILPADVGKQLQAAMLAPENVLEDARYLKVVPNDYVVELSEANYQRRYKPVEKLVSGQWREKLLETLNTINSRQGRKEYRFGGRLRIRLQPVADLDETGVRIHSQINPEAGIEAGETALACLELLPEGRQWLLQEDITTIGRDPTCEVSLDLPPVQRARLISSRHTYIHRQGSHFRLFDGSPDGKASVNGTFVNGRRVSPSGYSLQEGDVIILAALDPRQPRVDTPGVAALRFKMVNCE